MAGAAISPPATSAVDPSRSFFIILPLSLIRNWYVPIGLSDRRKVEARTPPTTAPATRQSYKTRCRNKGQEMDARENDSPHTCGVFVTFRACDAAIKKVL